MKQIIIINGRAKSGKDAFVQLCATLTEGRTWNLSTIDVVKNYAFSIGWDGKKDEKGRRFLSDLKDALTLYNDRPFESVVTAAESLRQGFVFIHCREPREIERLKKRLNAKTLLITRPGIETPKNHADENVGAYDYDFIINNNGTLEDLKSRAKRFITSF